MIVGLRTQLRAHGVVCFLCTLNGIRHGVEQVESRTIGGHSHIACTLNHVLCDFKGHGCPSSAYKVHSLPQIRSTLQKC